MVTIQDRRQQLLELFPEVAVEGSIDVLELLSVLGLEIQQPERQPASRELLHSMRNSIAVVQSGARVLQRRFAEDAEALQMLDAVIAASQALRSHIEQL